VIARSITLTHVRDLLPFLARGSNPGRNLITCCGKRSAEIYTCKRSVASMKNLQQLDDAASVKRIDRLLLVRWACKVWVSTVLSRLLHVGTDQFHSLQKVSGLQIEACIFLRDSKTRSIDLGICYGCMSFRKSDGVRILEQQRLTSTDTGMDLMKMSNLQLQQGTWCRALSCSGSTRPRRPTPIASSY
jgi:hypothetical protein